MDSISRFWFITGQFTGILSKQEIQSFLIEQGFTEEKLKELDNTLNELALIAYKDRCQTPIIPYIPLQVTTGFKS